MDQRHFENFTDEQLEEELNRRKKMRAETPQVRQNIDWSEVMSQAAAEVEAITSGEYNEDEDDKQYMYEAVMTAIYGSDYFEWANKNTP